MNSLKVNTSPTTINRNTWTVVGEDKSPSWFDDLVLRPLRSYLRLRAADFTAK